MTRTDVVASSRPQKANATTRRSGAVRRLLILPVAVAVALAIPTTAFAATEGTAGYTTPPTTPTTPTTPTPTTGTSPSKEKSTPEKTTAPATTSTVPSTSKSTTSPTTAKATKLPFTGFDLRWTIGAGALLVAMGFSIVIVQRRQRRDTGR